MINELKEKTIMLEKIIAKKNDLIFNDKNATLYYDDSSLKRLLTSSDSIKVSGFCDNRMMIYVNGDLMVNTELWDYVEYRYRPFTNFNPATDTLAIHGIDHNSGSASTCILYFNDIEASSSFYKNHLKCTIDSSEGWTEKDFDDSAWGGTFINYNTYWPGFWAEIFRPEIFCRYHAESLCQEGSELYGGKCWCSKNYKSENGQSPCVPCDDNDFTTSIGSSMCLCGKNKFSTNGYDTPNSCESCPGGCFILLTTNLY